MAVYTLDPLTDPRWPALVERHEDGSVFHSRPWLEALHRTHGYEPLVLTTTRPGGELANGIVLCKIKSWLTGRRLVSLPFSDHCQPLVEGSEDLAELLGELGRLVAHEGWRTAELRPLKIDPAVVGEGEEAFAPDSRFYYNRLDLKPDLDQIQKRIHSSSIRAKIRRAEREGYTYERGKSEALLSRFYALQVLTRRKHRLPPQPLYWFETLLDRFGEELEIHLMSREGEPIAAILTVLFKQGLFWKYSCSDARRDRFGVTRGLIWNSIRQAKEQGASFYDMGRSEIENEGLIKFKDRWGSERSELRYYRYPHRAPAGSTSSLPRELAKMTFARVPNSVLIFAGRALYRHIG